MEKNPVAGQTRFGGRSYACSSQSDGIDWEQTMINLRDAFPDQGVAFARSE